MVTDLGIALPPSWRRTSAPDRGMLVAARAPIVPVSGFRPEVALRSDSVSLGDLEGRLHDFAVEDEDHFDLMGHDVTYTRFAHRVGSVDVLCDQWVWQKEGLSVTLTCSVAREDYWDWCDVFEAIAETVDVGPRAA
ncbi:MAG: hypothetical protein M3237_16750 [Actinomycetota bacterium]|nr:hypothetical protein [Actinomycetota bacterium]